MSLKLKIISVCFIVILIIPSFAIIAIENYNTVFRRYEEVYSKYYQTVKMAQELTYRIVDRQASIRGFLLTGKTRYLVAYTEHILPIKSLINKGRELQREDDRYLQVIDRYEKLANEWEDKIAEVEKEMRQEMDYGEIDFDEYISSISNTDRHGRLILRGLKAVTNELIDIAESDMAEKSGSALEVAVSTKKSLMLLALVSLLVSVLTGFVLSNHITTPLKDVVRAAHKISRGDISHRIPIKRGDELGVLGNAFNHMVSRLEENIQVLKESEEKYSTLVEKANDGIVIIQDGKYVFVNQKFVDITGYAAQELQGIDYFGVLSSDCVDYVKNIHEKRIRGAKVPSIYETKVACKNGEVREVEVNAGLIVYKNRNAVLVIIRDISERLRYERDLIDLSEKLVHAQEEERKRISQELHDEVGQALSAININVEMLERTGNILSDASAKRLRDIRTLVEKSIDDIHRIAYDLRPHLLDDFGLVSALRWYTESFEDRTGIRVRLHLEGEASKLSPDIETLIYRVTQEALTNVSKHAEATKTDVLVDYRGKGISLTIADDGKGFNAEDRRSRYASRAGGMGLFGIRERVAVYGGRLDVESNSNGGGTKLLVQVPLRQEPFKDFL
ncbi:MAG: PAS domain S-box protein [Deltaproteobacteria bacterium]|nr:PAS domain S-box protein [Deltaproteobacteria bacterium]